MSILAEQNTGQGSSQGEPMRILLADDHPLILAGVRRTLERSEDIEIVGEARSAQELLALVARRRPQVVLMDLRMPDTKGTEAIQGVRAASPEVKIVVLSACDDRPSIDAALAAGASAYIVKSVDPVDIAAVLRQTWSGGNVYYAVPRAQAVTGRVAPEVEPPVVLTERERTVLGALAAGKTTAEISRQLWLSEHTVKYHLTNIYRKLEVSNRAAAVRRAFEHELVPSGISSGRAA